MYVVRESYYKAFESESFSDAVLNALDRVSAYRSWGFKILSFDADFYNELDIPCYVYCRLRGRVSVKNNKLVYHYITIKINKGE